MTEFSPSTFIEPDPLYGKAVALYPSDRFRVLLIAGLIGAPLALLIGFTVAQVEAWWGFVVTIVLMGLIAVALMWYVLHYWNREIVLYERGFSYREGSNTVFFFYAEIDKIFVRAEQLAYFGGLLRRTIYEFTLVSKKGETFKITNVYRRAAQLGARLNERVNLEMKPAVETKLAAGETVSFGEGFALSRDGIHVRGNTMAWADFGGWRAAQRQLHILDAAGDTWLSEPLSGLYNLTLLIELLRERTPKANA